MLDLDYHVENAVAEPFAAAPLLLFRLRIRQSAGESIPVHAIALRCQVRIDPARRRYQSGEQEKLRDLFSTPDRWSQTLRPMLWTHASVVVPPFTGSTLVDLPVPCTYDFNVAATKFFDSLREGEVPLSLLFSGTIFHEDEDRGLQVGQISWEKEATYRLPVRTWKEMMERYYPNTAWLCLRKDVFDRLHDYKCRLGLPTWEQAMENLLEAQRETV
jgi:hypothetical protein